MKKRVLSVLLAFVLIVGLCSGTQMFFMNVKAEETTPDVKVSVKTDKTELKPGDEVTVTVSVDSFKSTLEGDRDPSVNVVPDEPEASGKPMITTYQLAVPVDTNVFEFVSKKGGVIKKGAINYDAAESEVKAAAVYTVDDADNVIFEGTSSELYSFVLKVKSDLTENQTANLVVSGATLKNMYLTTNKLYSVGLTGASMKIIAKEVSSVEVTEKPAKTSYYVGNSGLDVTGGKVTVVYSNGEKEVIDLTSEMCSSVDFTTAGKKTVTVTYEGKTAAFDIDVVEKQAVSFTLNGVDNKNVTEDMKLNLEGMSADVVYDDGSSANVALIEDMLSYSTDKTGSATVQVKIGNITESFTVEVVAKELTGLEITSQPSKVVYLVNQKFDAAGLAVQAVYNNGTKADVTSSAKVSAADMTKVGAQTITVTYTEGTVTETAAFNIDVKSKEKIEAFNKSVKELSLKTLTAQDEATVKALRADYNAMSEVEKAEADVAGLVKLENQIKEIVKPEETKPAEDTQQPGTTDDKTNGSTEGSANVTEGQNQGSETAAAGNTAKEPQTGDTAPVAALILLFVAAAVIFVAVPKRKRVK